MSTVLGYMALGFLVLVFAAVVLGVLLHLLFGDDDLN